MADDGNEGAKAKDGLGTIVVDIHRVKVTGPWQGKVKPLKPHSSKPILLGEKPQEVKVDQRVGYTSPFKVLL